MLSVSQAGKILANLIVMGSAILGRAFIQAYRQALASKTFFPLYLIAGIFLSVLELDSLPPKNKKNKKRLF